jgi:hypothetical protein
MTVIYLTGLSHTYVCPCVDNKIIDDKYSVHMKNAEDRRRGGGDKDSSNTFRPSPCCRCTYSRDREAGRGKQQYGPAISSAYQQQCM